MNIFLNRRVGSLLLGLHVFVAVFGSRCDKITGDVEHLVKKFRQRQDFSGIVRLSDDKKRVVSVVGKTRKAFQGTPTEMASQFLKENSDLLGLKADLQDLRFINEHTRGLGANVEFQQFWKGLPVENGRIQINFDNQGRVLHVVNSYTPPTGDLDQTNIPKNQAVETVINEFLRITRDDSSQGEEQQKNRAGNTVARDELKLTEDPTVDDVFVERNGRLHRAYRIYINASRPSGSKEFVTDANSGEILHTRNYVSDAVDGQGQVFFPNPVNSQNNPELFKFGEQNDSINAVSLTNPNPYFTVKLLELKASTAPFKLSGPFVVLEDIEPPPNNPPETSNPDGFSFKRNDLKFEEVMVYFHIDRMQRYIQKELGFMNVMNRPLRADAHGFGGANNSRYFSTPQTLGQGYLAFGDGGTDGAEDGDVIAHEYGHAIQDNQAPGKYSGEGMPRAMGEGFGDYWAFSSFFNETVANGHDPRCLMEWEAVPGCLRRIHEGPSASSFNPSFKPWINGKIWSRTLFEIFIELGKITADRLIIESHFNFAGDTFRHGADAIMTADEELFGGANQPKLCQVFVIQKIYTASDCS